MLTKDKIDRINQLARKAKSEDLTPSEKNEQQALRQEYLLSVRNSFRNQLESITIVKVDDEGNEIERKSLKQ